MRGLIGLNGFGEAGLLNSLIAYPDMWNAKVTTGMNINDTMQTSRYALQFHINEVFPPMLNVPSLRGM